MGGAERPGGRRLGAALLLTALFVLLTRAALLSSPNDHLDGDEALMGVTVLHALDGRGIPVLPYGASFGVSWLENALSTGLAGALGVSVPVLRAAPLLLWLLGLLAVAGSTRALADARAGAAAALLLAAAPAWLHPSISAWHYNHTAFLACHLAVWLAARALEPRPVRPPLLLGLSLCASLAFFAQPIYALGTCPFVALLLWRRRRPADLGWLLLGFAACAGAYLGVRHGAHASWAPPLFADPDVAANLRSLPWRVWVAATGAYFLDSPLAAGPWTRGAAGLWCAAFAAAAASSAVHAWRRRRLTAGVTCLAAVALVLGFSLLVSPRLQGFRYLLPGFGFQAMTLALEAARLARRPAWRPLVLATALGLSGSPLVRGAPEARALTELVEWLDARGIRHVYSAGPMFQWKLIFASRERILARWIDREDRYPAYPRAVDRARAAGQPVALVGETRDLDGVRAQLARSGSAPLEVHGVAGRYFALVDPPLELLRRRFDVGP
jgi:hypothetical protein